MSHARSGLVLRRAGLPRAGTGTRSLVLVVLGCSLVGKLFDALPHPDAGYVPFVVAVFVLPVWYASGQARPVWERHRGLLVAVQAVLTYVPFAVFGEHWVGGVSGLLAGLVLLLVPGRAGWFLYAALAAAELTLWTVVGLPYEPSTNAVIWLLNAFANQSLILFGLTRLADVVQELGANRDALAGVEITRQRLTAHRHLRDTVQHRLQRVTALLETALTTPAEVIGNVLDAGRTARDAASDARRLALDLPDPTPAPGDPRPSETVAPRLARGITIAVLVLYSAQFLVNVCVPVAKQRPAWSIVLLAIGVAAAVVTLQLRHTTAATGPRPTGWPLTLPALALLCLAFYPTSGASSLGLLAFVAASGLLLIKNWSRWLLYGAVVVAFPVLALLDPAPEPQTLDQKLRWSTYAGATIAAASLLVFGLARLTQTVGQLRAVQEQVAGAARTQERLRLARDAHDMLGLGLATIALKTDLAAALAEQDPARSRQEIVQALHLTRLVATDVEAVSGDRVTLDFATEIATAQRSLQAAGIHTETDVDPTAQNVEALAAVLREGVTNILRHSRATSCRIRLTGTEETTALVVTNDGIIEVSGSSEAGRGLANLSERMLAVGGTLRTRIETQVFTLTAVVPVCSDVENRTLVPSLQA